MHILVHWGCKLQVYVARLCSMSMAETRKESLASLWTLHEAFHESGPRVRNIRKL